MIFENKKQNEAELNKEKSESVEVVKEPKVLINKATYNFPEKPFNDGDRFIFYR